MGAHFHMNTIYKDSIQNIINFLKDNKYQIIAAHLDGKEIESLTIDDSKWALILGNEANGLSDYSIKSANTLIKIDGEKSMESLNVAEAGSIIMHHLYKLK
jgi:TrmH family RNA methyltransferase